MKIKKLIWAVLAVLSVCACRQPEQPADKEMGALIDEVMQQSAAQYKLMAAHYAEQDTLVPRSYEGGKHVDSDIWWWCSGFFPGSLWYLYEYTRDDGLRQWAEKYTRRIEPVKNVTDHHDVGFMAYCSFGNGLRITADSAYYKEVLLTAVKSLTTRYKPEVGLIRSWDMNKDKWQYPVIIDNMMNLELLCWGTKVTGDSCYLNMAVSHADKTMEHQYRSDVSCYHVVSYDTIRGIPHLKQTHQGYSDSSSWSRGQAWGLYGYTMMYRETRDRKYLDWANKIARYLIDRLSMGDADGCPYWDFDDPDIPNALKDASAASIMASAFVELSQYVDRETALQYQQIAEKQLRTLSSAKYRAGTGENGFFILKHSVGSKPFGSEVDVPLTYADYYYLEALLRYKKYVLNDKLLFQSGFEGTCRVEPNRHSSDLLTPGFPTEHIVGVDTTLTEKNNWDTDFSENLNGGVFLLEYTGGDSTQRCVRIVADPVKPGNRVLMYALKDSWQASENQVKSRIQADIYGIKPGLKEFYQSVRLFVDNDFKLLEDYPDEIRWLTISEFWNNEWWMEGEQYGFRIGLGMGKLTKDKTELTFLLNAEDAGQVEVWRAYTDVKVPIGKWFTLEYYFKEGDKDSGRFWMAVTPDKEKRVVVFDVHDYTHNTSNPAPDGLTGYNPMKLYTSKELVSFMKDKGKELRLYWDDFKLWKNKKPE